MTFRAAQAAFFWRYTKGTYAPVYGRLDGGYSKDFLQSPAAQWPAIDKALGVPDPTIPVRFVWPGGHRDGHWQKSAVEGDVRGQLKWVTAQGAPLPWKVEDPATNPIATIPGDPTKNTAAAADAEFDALQAKKLDPWIIAIKLRDEPNVLHTRAYLGDPLVGQESRAISTLPDLLQTAIKALPQNTAGGAVEFPNALVRAPELVKRILRGLEVEPNVLLIGPPGTGKTIALEDIRELFERGSAVMFDPDLWENAWDTLRLPPADSRLCRSVVFHPSYSYEDFIAGLVPKATKEGFGLIARPGPLLSLAHWANEPKRHALLIIDEFNRGPAAAIFGDTLALLDVQKRSDPNEPATGAIIQRPFPTNSMEVEAIFANAKNGRTPPQEFKLPTKLWIVAALNSTDRSVAPLDAALRRRFAIIRTPPDYFALAKHFGIPALEAGTKFTPTSPDHALWTKADVLALALHVLRTLNDRILFVLGDDFLLGHALLWSVRGENREETTLSLGRAFDERITATLRLNFVDQDEPLAAILNVPEAQLGAEFGNQNSLAYWMLPPPQLQDTGSPRLKIRELGDLAADEVLNLLQSLL